MDFDEVQGYPWFSEQNKRPSDNMVRQYSTTIFYRFFPFINKCSKKDQSSVGIRQCSD